MQFHRHNLFGPQLAMLLGAVVAVWVLAGSASAQEDHAHEGEAAHAHEGDEAHTHEGEGAHAHDGDAAGHGEEAGDDGDEHGDSLASDLPFWGIIAFIGFLFAIKKLGWSSLTSGMAAREAEEQKLINDAEELRRQAAEQLTTQRGQMEALDEHVRAALAEAERDADHTRSDIRAAADREVANVRSRVDLEINRVKDQTLNDLFENFTQRVIDSTQDRLRGQLDPAAQDRLIGAALDEFAAGKQ